MSTTTNVRQLSQQIKTFIKQTVVEVLDDPDFGLVLTDKAKRRLRSAGQGHGVTTPLAKIKERYY